MIPILSFVKGPREKRSRASWWRPTDRWREHVNDQKRRVMPRFSIPKPEPPADSWWARPECQADRMKFREALAARMPFMDGPKDGE